MGEKDSKNIKKDLNNILYMTMIINGFLVIMKLTAGILSNSKGLMADGFHSASDVITTIGVLIALGLAKKPRDQKHPYGHEKIETVVTFLLSIVLIIVGFNIGLSSFRALMQRDMVIVGGYVFFVAIISIILKEFQYQITIKMAKKINSDALKADAWHHRSDALSSVAALIGIIGAYLGYTVIDSLMGLAVSLIVIKVGFDILKDSFHGLIDVSIKSEELEEIKELILNLEEIIHINDIRTRKHGSVVYVDIKVCVNPYMEIHEGHQVADKIEEIIRNRIQHLEDVIVHLDPCMLESKDKPNCQKEDCNV
ncbi:cation diffusion facilitator family transporter [Alkaliphilus transvaalensis]|uniref:cation diffusion facilitator family transporter n=1 Tax=Alkaliphilus transvaalensis TaxID=114628 RepID=UPI0006842F87|nr:cation diffusion facilitator family transporter [Alkaliphilus transvaalensis]